MRNQRGIVLVAVSDYRASLIAIALCPNRARCQHRLGDYQRSTGQQQAETNLVEFSIWVFYRHGFPLAVQENPQPAHLPTARKDFSHEFAVKSTGRRHATIRYISFDTSSHHTWGNDGVLIQLTNATKHNNCPIVLQCGFGNFLMPERKHLPIPTNECRRRNTFV